VRKFTVIAVTVSILLPLFKTSTWAEETKTTTLISAADATIIDGNSSNYGGDSTLDCAHDGDTEFFLIRFDFGVIPSNAEVQTATLALNQISVSGDDVSINVYKLTESWSETTVSGVNKPNFDSGVTYGVLSTDSNTGEKIFPQNFSDLVQIWLNNPSSNFGLYFEATSSATYAHEFGSRESMVETERPRITLSYLVPDQESPVISEVTVSSVTATGVTITWITDEEASSFVDYGETSTYGKVMGSDQPTTSHVVDISGLKSDTIYYFRVRSKDLAENEAESTDSTFQTLPDTEDKQEDLVSDEIKPPTNLKSSSGRRDDNHYVELEWEPPENFEVDAYKIYRSEEDSLSYILLAEVESDENNFRDGEVEEGMTYFYVVRSVKGDEESEDSNEEVITIYGSELEEGLHKLNFWQGLIIFNVIVLPIFGLLYYRYKKKSKKLKNKKK